MKIIGTIDDANEPVPVRGRRSGNGEYDNLFAQVVAETHTRVPDQRRGHRWLKIETPNVKQHDKLAKAVRVRARRGGWEMRAAWRAGATKGEPGISYLMVTKPAPTPPPAGGKAKS